ncbi:hypothetical protein V1264_008679 [Littorina saxatilis]|uniref:Uncharacterized protein n=1 Tax=Littorina saxatilis TaxID=31220 RepID=A0AAN9G2J8_9CAEN
MVLDFAENYTCTYQNEVEAAHWHKSSVTLHPIVTYYACPKGCGEAVTESLAFVSNDTVHDFNAVHHFTKMAVEHLTGTRGLCLQRIITWTDGCASQYKSKGPFADISHVFQDYGVAFERHLFGSRHGKGPSDGESAVIKSHAFNATKAGRTDIATAEDLYNYCQTSALNKQPHDEDQCHHLLRTFFWVAEGEILRQRGRQEQTLKGTRSLHAVRCVEANTVATRDLSCMCDACLSGIGECSNIESVAPWQNQVLKAVAPAQQPAARRQQIQQRVRRQLAVRANRPPALVVRAAAVNQQVFVSDTSDTDSSSPPFSSSTPFT